MNMDLLIRLNTAFFIIVTFFYSYQFLYLLLPFLKKEKVVDKASTLHTYGVVIAARNEEAVIGDLIQSIRRQDYSAEKIKIFVVADNCTDNTARVAKKLGAIVYQRQNKQQVGKGYALDYLFQRIFADYGKDVVEAYLVFDADNLLDKHYITEINQLFAQGHPIITSYRNSKNYDSSWVASGQSLYFLKESQYINRSRMLLRSGCAVSGTGFLVSAKIIQAQKGWKFHTLVEDIEFSVYHAIRGNKIAFCENAVFYDEQPRSFLQSWQQRLRWSKGFYQVFFKYGLALFQAIFKEGGFYAFDLFLKIFPLGFFSGILLLVNLLALFFGYDVSAFAQFLLWGIKRAYLLVFLSGLLTLLSEWKKIFAAPIKKIISLFTFPIFLATFLPVSFIAAFKHVDWQPITHQGTTSLALAQKENSS